MAIIGRFHPLLIHFPIALVLVALGAEAAAIRTADYRWRVAAVINLRAGAAFAILAALTGSQLSHSPGIDGMPFLEWHRSFGIAGAVTSLGAAWWSGAANRWPVTAAWRYRAALLAAAVCVALAGHFGGLLVWGADFLRP
jgi:uncharacterized membrane protein